MSNPVGGDHRRRGGPAAPVRAHGPGHRPARHHDRPGGLPAAAPGRPPLPRLGQRRGRRRRGLRDPGRIKSTAQSRHGEAIYLSGDLRDTSSRSDKFPS